MVGDEADGDVGDVAVAQLVSRHGLDAVDQSGQHVGGVQRRAAGEDGEDALQSRAGVDVARGQVGQRPVGVPEVLREDEVPDLDEPILGIGVLGPPSGPSSGP